MKIIKFLRRPYLSMIIAVLVLYASCNEHDSELNQTTKYSFKYDSYNSTKKAIDNIDALDVKGLKFIVNNSTLNRFDSKKQVLDFINNSLGHTPILRIEALEYFDVDGQNIVNKAIVDSVLSSQDYELLNNFAKDLTNYGVDMALANLEEKINLLDLDEFEFNKYNEFVNQFLMIKDDMDNNNIDLLESRSGWGCAFAIAGYTLATVAVGAACTPNPTTPIACPLAITRAVVAYGSMIAACSD
ncbi:hypothetical protein RQM59_03345 [Flavobacteriaceae bacterium S356]|uniref:Lipoprotein n=1 Tax=Asprobacillus argus TaxID=3076534 RepID=A0ABU3LDV7_9FLAO|nr:hypothetical protein [Flavobacteriaceae bacterium S356]